MLLNNQINRLLADLSLSDRISALVVSLAKNNVNLESTCASLFATLIALSRDLNDVGRNHLCVALREAADDLAISPRRSLLVDDEMSTRIH